MFTHGIRRNDTRRSRLSNEYDTPSGSSGSHLRQTFANNTPGTELENKSPGDLFDHGWQGLFISLEQNCNRFFRNLAMMLSTMIGHWSFLIY